jgi:plasmid maintenance system antidote protein VapI
MTRATLTISEALRRAVAGSELALAALGRATGVDRASLRRFLRGERSLRLDMADRLAAYFGLELRPKRKKG